MSKASQSWMKRAPLSAPSGVDRAGQVVRVVGDHAHRLALDADEGGDHADAELLADLQDGVRVGDRLDDLLHVVEAQAVLRHDVAQAALVVRLPIRDRALEVGEVLLGDLARFGLILRQDVDDAVGHLEGHRPDLFGGVDAEAPALDHRRAAHPDRRSLRRDDHVAQGERHCVRRKAAAVRDPNEGDEAAELAELRVHVAVERDARHAVVTGPPAAALGEQDERQHEAVAQIDHALLLVAGACAPRAGQDRVVVGDNAGARGFLPEEVGVDRARAANQGVRGGVLAQRLLVVALVLGRHDQRPVTP